MNVLATKKGPRISLAQVFSAGLVVILSVFVLLSYFTFTRLLSFESTLKNVANKSLPDLIHISRLYSQAARLLESTELLSKSSSDASKRLTRIQLETNLNIIRNSGKESFENEFLDTLLNTITIELDEFATLIDYRLQTGVQIEMLMSQIYELNARAIEDQPQNSAAWILAFSQATVNVNRALNAQKLQDVRLRFNQLEKQLNKLNSIFAKKQDRAFIDQLTHQFKMILFSESGMEALKIKSLRLKGRVIGRENFVHNLIEDYVAQLGFFTNQTEQQITLQVGLSVVEMKKQTQFIRFILIGGIIFLLAIVVLFQQRILKRIRIFTHIVRSETQGFEYQSKLSGNDEITDLAETFKEFTQIIENQKIKLQQLSMLDGLTGIANRRALDVRLQHDIDLSVRQKSMISILLMDIDCFKLYNDNYGHLAGDERLKDVSNMVSDLLHRESDFVARYGGEEFICVLPNTDLVGAQEVALNVIAKLKAIALPHKYSNVADYLTMSIGIATSQPIDVLTPEEIMKRADTALYAAKKTGKNTYRLYSSSKLLN